MTCSGECHNISALGLRIQIPFTARARVSSSRASALAVIFSPRLAFGVENRRRCGAFLQVRWANVTSIGPKRARFA